MKALFDDADVPYREVLPVQVQTSERGARAEPADHPYRAAAPNDDSERILAELEAAAPAVFQAWAKELPAGPRDARELIRAVRPELRLIARLTTSLEQKRCSWRSAPYDGDEPDSEAPLSPEELDAFAPPTGLREASRHVTKCSGCGGAGRISCLMCAGRGVVPCKTCRGQGKESQKGRHWLDRRLDCPRCRGKAVVSCRNCTRGSLRCDDCAGTTRQERWLEVTGALRSAEVRVAPAAALRAFAWAANAAASDEEIARDVELVCRVTAQRALRPSDLPPSVPESWRAAHWADLEPRPEGADAMREWILAEATEPLSASTRDWLRERLHERTIEQANERVCQQTLTFYQVPIVEVTYQIGAELARTAFMGWRLLAPDPSYQPIFQRRARRLLAFGAGLTTPSLAVLGSYAAGLLGLGAALGALSGAVASSLLLYRLVARRTLKSASPAPRALASGPPGGEEPASSR